MKAPNTELLITYPNEDDENGGIYILELHARQQWKL